MVVNGIAESPDATWMESEDKVRETISEKLKMDHRKNEVERAHRTGKHTTGPGDWHRPIVVKFLRFKDKIAVLERVMILRGKFKKFSMRNILKLCSRRGNNLSQP
jgi:hypothetical protein